MPVPPDDARQLTRREFLAGAGALALSTSTAAGPATLPKAELGEVGITDAAERMSRGMVTSHALTQAYLERIAAVDRRGPMLRAVIELNPEALAIAAARDAERKAGRVRGPLHGVPLLIKDNIGTADRMSTTAGCAGLEGHRPREDAPVAAALREAGAVILGKTNLSEWANFRSSNSVSGWSSRGGQTRNPYALERTPSGSSSGSAVAVAANLCVAAIGTETDGSITSPAACNSLAGMKPTLGVVSATGIIPIAHSQDTAGPMARSVEDCALLMNAIAAKRGDFTAQLARHDLKGVRLGVGRQFYGVNEKADGVIDTALAALRDLGATLVDVEIPSFGKLDEAEFDILLFEFRHDLAEYFRTQMPEAPFKTLADVIEYNARHAAAMMPIFGQDLMVKSWEKGPLASPAYRKALATSRRLSRGGGIDAALRKHRVEAIVALTSPPAWFIDVVNGDAARGGCTQLPAMAGYPHVTVPAGFAGGLPVGLSFFGTAFTDAKLLGFARAFERATTSRRPPG